MSPVPTPVTTPAPTNEAPLVVIGGRRFRLRLGLADASLQSIVAILQDEAAPPFNDHHNMRRMAIGLAEMALQWAEGAADRINRPPPSPDAILTFLQDLLRDEFYPLHARRQEARAQQERPS